MLKELEGIFYLDHNIKLYIPSTIDVDKTIDTSSYIDLVSKKFASWFGGFTDAQGIRPARGGWLAKNGEVVTEQVTIVESYASPEAVAEHIGKVLALANKIKKELKQEAISLEYNNKLFLV